MEIECHINADIALVVCKGRFDAFGAGRFEAQMTPDISKLVENLKTVKQLIPNNPVINPGRDYEVKKNSKAIVIELSISKLNVPKIGEG